MNQQKILLMHSEPRFIKKAHEILKDSYETFAAFSRQEGLRKAKEEHPDLVIIGFLEPRGESFRLCKQLREYPATGNIPLLVVDVRPEEHSRKGWHKEETLRLHVEGYVAEPLDLVELKQEVTAIIRRCRSAKAKSENRETLDQVGSVLEQMEQIEKHLSK